MSSVVIAKEADVGWRLLASLVVAKTFANCIYCKVASSDTSRLEAHARVFQIPYEGDF